MGVGGSQRRLGTGWRRWRWRSSSARSSSTLEASTSTSRWSSSRSRTARTTPSSRPMWPTPSPCTRRHRGTSADQGHVATVDFVQLVILGVLGGGVNVAVGVGFGLVWGVLNIVNLAHGALVIIGGYITWQLLSALHIDPFLTLPVDAVALFLLGYTMQRGVINRIIRAPLLFTFLLTFGLNLILVNVLLLVFGSDFRSVTPSYSGQGLELAQIVIPYARRTSLGIAILLSAPLPFILNPTRIRLALTPIAAARAA